MSNGCMNCGGLIAEEGKVYGYAGKFCNCSKPSKYGAGETFKPWPTFPPAQPGSKPWKPGPGQTVVAAPLTEADVRRIVREELAKDHP